MVSVYVFALVVAGVSSHMNILGPRLGAVDEDAAIRFRPMNRAPSAVPFGGFPAPPVESRWQFTAPARTFKLAPSPVGLSVPLQRIRTLWLDVGGVIDI
jgi:hypothetical protein